ncbi:hypothetical protein JRQ81_009749 [Phrynocephalus forsythii]|uniref:Amiloride-sensitive sodium channel subunit delta n=1 Tax=Phrynocephalus forsythii TaxID=171643 RepID=A0A9Q0X8Q9_9SAUR|nr:hypothetical protein JRQ81_009749 [Phrynocephalus forsythii]
MGKDVAGETQAKPKEEDAALIEFYSSFRDLFEFFCLNTTIHGTVRLVCSSRNRMKTAFWILLFFTTFGMLYWQFALLFNRYWSYPVTVSLAVHSEPKMFPAVTICNLNPYRIHAVAKNMVQLDALARETIYNIYGFNTPEKELEDNESLPLEEWPNWRETKANGSSFHLDRNVALVKMGDKVGFRLCNATGGACYNMLYASGVHAVQEWYRFHYMNIMSQVPSVFDVPHNEDDIGHLVYACQYDGEACRAKDSEYFHHPAYGSCYTFNKNGTDSFWEAYKPGVPFGLSLILKVEQKDHIPLLSTVAGVKVLIHNHNQPPFLEHEGFDIRPGVESTIGIRQDEVNRLGGVYGQCTENGENVNIELLYNSQYTMQACLHTCFQHQMIKKCGCAYYYYPLPSGEEYCNYNKHPAWGHCFYQLYKQLAYHKVICFHECPKPCKESWYILSAGYAKWPSTKSEDWIHRALQAQNSYNMSNNNRNDISMVNIYFEKLDYNSWDESPEFTLTLLMSSMGSQWSLWFGSSVLSVAELLEFLLDTLILTLIFLYRRLTAKTHKLTRPPKARSESLILENYRHMEEGTATDESNDKAAEAMTAMTADDSHTSACQKDGPPPYAKCNKHQLPEWPSGVVLNAFTNIVRT